MVNNYLEKQETINKKTMEEINTLENEYADIKSKYDKKINKLNDFLTKIKNTKYLDLYDSANAICYLVSLMDNKEYLLQEAKITIKKGSVSNYFNHFLTIDNIYNLLYLVEKNNVELVKEEIFNKFNQENNAIYLENSNDNYIQLAYYRENNDKYIYYSKNFDGSNNIQSKIVDDKYTYIYDYINSILNYKLEVIDFGISFEEMRVLATKFVYDNKGIIKTLKK